MSLKGSESVHDSQVIRPESAPNRDLNRHVWNRECSTLEMRIIRDRSKPGPYFDQPVAPELVPDSGGF